MKLDDFRVGDLLLFADKGRKEAVAILQGVERTFTLGINTWRGSIYTHHAAVVVGSGETPRIAHSAGGGARLVSLASQFGRGMPYGKVIAYRLKGENDREAYGPAAAEVARTWASTKQISYGKAHKPGLGSSGFGRNAKKRAQALSNQFETAFSNSRDKWVECGETHKTILMRINNDMSCPLRKKFFSMWLELTTLLQKCPTVGSNPRLMASSYLQ